MSIAAAEELLQQIYGYPQFRDGQRQIITSLLAGKDTFGVMPTGGGKSICYQIPAMLMDGVTLVISPLISLMKDQVDALKQVGVSATYINSSLNGYQVEQRISAARKGAYKLLYIAPERLESAGFLETLRTLDVSLIAIDEAHCISTWGHDFRPSYRLIPQMIQQLAQKPTLLALTATATVAVQRDIVQLLSIDSENLYIASFARENLLFSVQKESDKRTFISEYLQKRRGQTGIIYASTRKAVDQLHEYLAEQGYQVARYHAGMADEDRKRSQNLFSYDQIQVMVATNAFGMGIDKSNVRFVIHYQLPRDIESYYQEAGRAGRDGLMSECVLLYQPNDVHLHRYLIDRSELSPDRRSYELRKLWQMDQYGRTGDCLSATIMRYFGEETTEDCGQCLNCYRREHGEKQDFTLEAQKIFSCIKRMKERYGLTMVARVLVGSNSKQVRQFGLDRLSTYGIMREYTQKKVTSLCQLLVSEGYIMLGGESDSLPLARLTTAAYQVLSGEQRVFLYAQQDTDWSAPDTADHQQLFESLRSLRQTISQQEAVPPYVIFHDSVLKQMCQVLPRDQTQMLQMKGVGERKFAKYGERFLAVIHTYLAEHGESNQPPAVEASPLEQLRRKHRHAYQPWTPEQEQQLIQLFEAGKPIIEMENAIGRQSGAIRSRLIKLGLLEADEVDSV